MSIFSIELLDNEPDLQNFTCGVPSVDKMVKKSYFQHILLKTRVYKITFSEYTVGYFQISFRNVDMAGSDILFADDGDSEDETRRYGVLHVDFLAVQEELQHKGLGTATLTYILNESRELRKKWPIRLVLIDALYDKAEWYQKHGFGYVKENQKDSDYGTVEMYFELMTEEEMSTVTKFFEKFEE